MVAVKYEELLLAFDFVNSVPVGEHATHVSLDTGQMFWISEMNPVGEKLPEDIDTSGGTRLKKIASSTR